MGNPNPTVTTAQVTEKVTDEVGKELEKLEGEIVVIKEHLPVLQLEVTGILLNLSELFPPIKIVNWRLNRTPRSKVWVLTLYFSGNVYASFVQRQAFRSCRLISEVRAYMVRD